MKDILGEQPGSIAYIFIGKAYCRRQCIGLRFTVNVSCVLWRARSSALTAC